MASRLNVVRRECMEGIRQDTRSALRLIARRPGFTTISLLTLALGIGANSAIFSVVNAVVWRGLPFDEPDRLVQVFGIVERETADTRAVSYPDYVDWLEGNQVFEYFAARDIGSVNLTQGEEAELLQAAFVSASYFSLLGARPVVGRVFSGREDRMQEPVAVIGHGLWRDRFGADPAVVGTTMRLNGVATAIIGVGPVGFGGIGGDVDLWLPLLNGVAVRSDRPAAHFEQRHERFLTTIARLKPGVSVEEGQANVALISAALREEFPASNANRGAAVLSLEDQILGEAQRAALLLLGAAWLVLLIACANVANLRIARDVSRRKELALRQALGASRGRIVQHLLTESLIVALVGGALGLLVALWMSEFILAVNPISIPAYVSIAMDANVLWFTFLLSLVAGVVFGLIPALTVTDTRAAEILRGVSRGAEDPDDRGKIWNPRTAIVVAQVALALVILIGAALLVRSLAGQMTIDPGVDRHNLLTLSVQLPPSRYDLRTVREFGDRVTDRMGSLPSVEGVALASFLPLTGRSNAISLVVEDQVAPWPSERVRVYRHRVTPGFFETMGIPIIGGRPFHDADTEGSEGVVIASERMAQRIWPGERAIGKRVSLEGNEGPWYKVVGVARHVRHRSLMENTDAEASDPDLYFPLYQVPVLRLDVAVRTAVAPETVMASVRRKFREIDPSVPVFNMASFDELIEAEIALTRYASMQLGSYGLIALLLASVGLYGVISHTVTRRTKEIGIRVALGAHPRAVVTLMLRQGVWVIAAGVALGLLGAYAGTRVMANQLYGVTTTDLPTYLGVSAVLSGVGLLACLVPARRAIRVDPRKALTEE